VSTGASNGVCTGARDGTMARVEVITGPERRTAERRCRRRQFRPYARTPDCRNLAWIGRCWRRAGQFVRNRVCFSAASNRVVRIISNRSASRVGFAADSPLEGAGFEPSVPRQESRRFEPASVPSPRHPARARCRRGGVVLARRGPRPRGRPGRGSQVRTGLVWGFFCQAVDEGQ